MRTYKFPKGFVWGTAASAHQTEGNNTNSDWWHWETSKTPDKQYPKEPSGIACDSYNRFEEDFDLCHKLNNNAVRISVEWARIQPEENEFDQHEIDHYKKVLQAARARGLQTFVTLHHFSNPLWFSKKGGWLNVNSPKMFADYSQKCAQEFGELIDVYLTINEPQVLALLSYVKGTWPPNITNYFASLIVQINLIRAHKSAYKKIKSVGNFKVGLVKHIMWFYPAADSSYKLLDKLAVGFINFINSGFFLNPIKRNLDVLGVNFYFSNRIRHLKRANLDDRMSDLNWWIYPKGLEMVLKSLKKYNLPIYVTENGVADSQDKIRSGFITDMLMACHKAIDYGVDIKGYFYWSLLDNFEWHEGFWPRFGLVYIDRQNGLKRVPRSSFFHYSEICRKNAIRA